MPIASKIGESILVRVFIITYRGVALVDDWLVVGFQFVKGLADRVGELAIRERIEPQRQTSDGQVYDPAVTGFDFESSDLCEPSPLTFSIG